MKREIRTISGHLNCFNFAIMKKKFDLTLFKDDAVGCIHLLRQSLEGGGGGQRFLTANAKFPYKNSDKGRGEVQKALT